MGQQDAHILDRCDQVVLDLLAPEPPPAGAFDGIVLRTKTGISKIYFVELPKDVQERFHYGSATPTGKAVTQRIGGESAVDRFAQQVQKKLDNRESILQGKHTPGPAELMVTREINFHKAFLAGTAIIAIVLFAVVWTRFK